MRNYKYHSELTIQSLDLDVFETIYSAGLWFNWGGTTWMLFVDQEFMSSMRIIAVARMTGKKQKEFFRKPGREMLTMLLESEKHVKQALSRIGNADLIFDTLVDVIHERVQYGLNRAKFHPEELVYEDPTIDVTKSDELVAQREKERYA